MRENKLSRRDVVMALLAVLLLSAVIALVIFLGGEDSSPRKKQYYGYFDTVTVIYDYSDGGEEAFAENCRLVTELFDYYNKLFDIYREYEGLTNIATLNRLAGQGPVAIDRALLDFLEYAIGIYDMTGGEVNVAMGAVLSIWHDYREAGLKNPDKAALPDMSELASAAEHCDIGGLIIDKSASTVELSDSQMSLDVGAVAKGYAVEMAARLLEGRGVSSYVIDSGGNLRAIGSKPDGTGWSMGVKNPARPHSADYVYTTVLTDSAAATSGNYERYYTVGGKRYHHIIDKDTLMPSEMFASVTVILPDAGLADSLSTALFNMGYEEGKSLIETIDGARAVWVHKDGTVQITD